MSFKILFLLGLLKISRVIGEPSLNSYDRKPNQNGEELAGYTETLRWYINKDDGSCTEFGYKGKGLDFNNYKSLEECVNHKSFTEKEQSEECDAVAKSTVIPTQPPTSICQNTKGEIRYYMKVEQIESLPKVYSCEPFVYKGCGTSANNFKTYEDCTRICLPKNKNKFEKMRCQTDVTFAEASLSENDARTVVVADHSEKRCVHMNVKENMITNSGVFESLTDCVITCFSENLITNPKCKNQPKNGRCVGKITERFYFDAYKQKCLLYLANDCLIGDEENSFETMNECIGTCPTNNDSTSKNHQNIATNLCGENPDQGEGQLHLIKYYFSHTQQKCNKFLFRGIGGNDNRFDTRSECVSVCTGKNLAVEDVDYAVEEIIPDIPPVIPTVVDDPSATAVTNQ